MVGNFTLPPTGYGPGSQIGDSDGAELEYMPMPQDMRTFTTHIPEAETDADLTQALDLLSTLADACNAVAKGGDNRQFPLASLNPANRALIAETLGQGEVSMRLHGIPAVAAQESVFAGVWLLQGAEHDLIEVGAVPELAYTRAFEPRQPAQGSDTPLLSGVVNAPPLLVELQDKSQGHAPGVEVHVINLTLLPHTEQDLAWIETATGQGSVDILSRGYGNCRIRATALPQVWRVQFFNSMDVLILDTFEVSAMPEVAIAAVEDFEDSAARIREVLEAIR